MAVAEAMDLAVFREHPDCGGLKECLRAARNFIARAESVGYGLAEHESRSVTGKLGTFSIIPMSDSAVSMSKYSANRCFRATDAAGLTNSANILLETGAFGSGQCSFGPKKSSAAVHCDQ